MLTETEIQALVEEFRKQGIIATSRHIDDGKEDIIINWQGKHLVTIHPDGTYTMPEPDC